MSDEGLERFDAGASDWVAYNQGLLGRLRGEVTWHNLLPHLTAPAPGCRLRALDCGGGSGELALRLARHGYRTWLLDYAPAMLEQARLAAGHLPHEVRERLTFRCLAAEEAHAVFERGFFHLVACHTVVEYLADPGALLADLGALLCGGGLLSVTFVNRHAEALRQVVSHGDPRGARRALQDGRFDASLFGLSGTAYTAKEVGGWLVAAGLEVIDTRGVRIFADFVPRQRLQDPAFFQELTSLEILAAAEFPLNRMARYLHLVALKPLT